MRGLYFARSGKSQRPLAVHDIAEGETGSFDERSDGLDSESRPRLISVTEQHRHPEPLSVFYASSTRYYVGRIAVPRVFRENV